MDSQQIIGICNSLTDFEKHVLGAIARSDFGDTLTSDTWTFSVLDDMNEGGPTAKQLSGVVSSLSKKGLTRSSGTGRDQTIRMTDIGARAWATMNIGPWKGEKDGKGK